MRRAAKKNNGAARKECVGEKLIFEKKETIVLLFYWQLRREVLFGTRGRPINGLFERGSTVETGYIMAHSLTINIIIRVAKSDD